MIRSCILLTRIAGSNQGLLIETSATDCLRRLKPEIQFLSHRKHRVSITDITDFRPQGSIALYSDNCTNLINTICEKSAEFLNVKRCDNCNQAMGVFFQNSYHCLHVTIHTHNCGFCSWLIWSTLAFFECRLRRITNNCTRKSDKNLDTSLRLNFFWGDNIKLRLHTDMEICRKYI